MYQGGEDTKKENCVCQSERNGEAERERERARDGQREKEIQREKERERVWYHV